MESSDTRIKKSQIMLKQILQGGPDYVTNANILLQNGSSV